MKQGVQKRDLSMARSFLATLVLQVGACAQAGCGVLASQRASRRPDAVEGVGGHCEIRYQATRRGWSATQPFDRLCGRDMCQAGLARVRPRLVVVSCPCAL